MNTFKTKKGTELPLTDIKGKDYLQVAYRLVWFREEHPDWSIFTEITKLDTEKHYCIFSARISNEQSKTLATAHKVETKEGFADYLEKAETGAVGRALAMCGYGTQFAPELEEGERLADVPVSHQDEFIQSLEEDQKKELPKDCTTCHGPIWDNRVGKKNPKAPDWKCKSASCLDAKGYVTAGWL